jgi:hypothetical protein
MARRFSNCFRRERVKRPSHDQRDSAFGDTDSVFVDRVVASRGGFFTENVKIAPYHRPMVERSSREFFSNN